MVVDETPALQPILEFAADQIAKLTAVIDGGSNHEPTLAMVRDNHQAHAEELARILGVDIPAGSDELEGDALAALNQREAEGAEEATTACVEASPQFAVLLGEIAACRASHSDVLGVIGG